MWTNQFTNLMKETQGDRTSENFLDLNNDLTFAIFMIKFLAPKYRFRRNTCSGIDLIKVEGDTRINNSTGKKYDLFIQISDNLFIKSLKIIIFNEYLTQLRLFLQKTLSCYIYKELSSINISCDRDRQTKDHNISTWLKVVEKINTEEKFNLLIKSIRDIIVSQLYKY